MNKLLTILAALLALNSVAATVLYQNDFEKEELDKVPPSFLVLDGEFTVKQIDGNKRLELPGAPLDAFGLLFGPATNGNLTVSARAIGTGKGRRYPTFGVGLLGSAGFKLQVSPAKGALEILRGDAPVASEAFKWKSGAWTTLTLRVRATGEGKWRVEGKAWSEGAEPAEWLVGADVTELPPPGRSSVWGSPISGTPIGFDDLALTVE